jgi:hypothetical protein
VLVLTIWLWIRALDSLAAQRIVGSEGAAFPFWSPDGRFVGFFADRKLKKVALASGVVQVICDAGGGGGGTWNEDDVLAQIDARADVFKQPGMLRVRTERTEK